MMPKAVMICDHDSWICVEILATYVSIVTIQPIIAAQQVTQEFSRTDVFLLMEYDVP